MKAREINNTIRYTMWSVFKATRPIEDAAEQVADGALRAIERGTRDADHHHNEDFEIRGWYDVSGLRADADLMVWWHAPSSDTLQDAYHALRRSDLGRGLEPVWSQLALHRPAEFNKGHVPAGGRGPQLAHEVDDAVQLVGLEGEHPLVVAEREGRHGVGPHVGVLARHLPVLREQRSAVGVWH